MKKKRVNKVEDRPHPLHKKLLDLFVIFDYLLVGLFSFLCFISLLSGNWFYTIIFALIAVAMSPLTERYLEIKGVRNARVWKLVIVVVLLLVFAIETNVVNKEEKKIEGEKDYTMTAANPDNTGSGAEVVDVKVS